MAISFQDALQNLINAHSIEKGSDTPDWMLAEYLCDCLATYEVIIAKREKWYAAKWAAARQRQVRSNREANQVLGVPHPTPTQCLVACAGTQDV